MCYDIWSELSHAHVMQVEAECTSGPHTAKRQPCKDRMYRVLIHEQTVILERLGKDLGNLSKAQRQSQCHCHVLRGLWK